MNLRRVGVACGVAATIVVLVAWLLPREYLANDDIGLTEYLRANAYTPWISPILVRGFAFAYAQAPGVPWFGLYQYTLLFASCAILIHSCLELVDRRPGIGKVATWIGAALLVASQSVLVIGVTWTTASITALGTSLAAFVAYVIGHAGSRLSIVRCAIYGLVFVNGFMLRSQGLGAIAVALAPLLVWAAIRCWRQRYLPRPAAVLGFVAPFAVAFVFQGRVPVTHGDHWAGYPEWSEARGKLHGSAAFAYLDTRAPEVIKRAGWTLQEYRDFSNWLIIDEDEFPVSKLERLVDTGGVPVVVTLGWSLEQIREIFFDSATSVTLFVIFVVAGVMLGVLRIVPRQLSIAYSAGYLLVVTITPVWLSAHIRFPQRVSLGFYAIAALGMFVFLAMVIPKGSDDATPPDIDRKTIAGFSVIAVLVIVWARFTLSWFDRDIQPYRDARQAFEDRVAARGGFVFSYVGGGLVELDPLRARPRDYDALEGGWGTFSSHWYATLAKLGVNRGADTFRAMVDNPNAYMVAVAGVRDGLEEWVRRKLGDSTVRLALVDAAEIPGVMRPEAYRLRSTAMNRNDEEWQTIARVEKEQAALLPGPPDTSNLTFQPVPLAPPYEPLISKIVDPQNKVTIEAIDGGIRCTVMPLIPSSEAGCAAATDNRERGFDAGIHIPLHGLVAARFQLSLIDPQNIVAVHVFAQTATSRSIRWRWILTPAGRQFGSTASFTLVPTYDSHQLELRSHTADPRDVRALHIFIEVLPGTHAAFELRKLELAREAQ